MNALFTERFDLRLPPRLAQALDAAARQQQRTKTEIIRSALRRELSSSGGGGVVADGTGGEPR